MSDSVLVVNAGSSSLKVAVFPSSGELRRLASAQVDRIGQSRPSLSLKLADGQTKNEEIDVENHRSALEAILARLNSAEWKAIGHRIVHGGPLYAAPEWITSEMLDALRGLEPFDPLHLPAQIDLIESTLACFPGVPQVACFDTGFHHDLPAVARRLPIPRKFDDFGVRRYGFHGLSFTYLMEELGRLDPVAASGRVVLAHLGSGASLAAVQNGRCLDTSMALTPAAGIPMATRSGDLDPGLVDYLYRACGVTIERFNHMVNYESGLLGMSGTSSDMQQLLQLEVTDPRAAEAITAFCYQIKKTIGAYAAALGGLDALVFAGGIGENSSATRARICAGLEFLGVELDPGQNESKATVISSSAHPVKVFVIPTDEELIIAREARQLVQRP